MKMTQQDYQHMSDLASPKTKSYQTIPMAFLIGGLICTIGQALTNLYTHLGLSEKDAALTTSISLIFLSALLTGLKVYDNIAKYAGAGTLVPITGFANAVVSPALEFKSEGYVLGLGAKMFIIAGPVIVYGTLASVLYGLILFLFKLY
ncbi:MAG TPA: stage V sporulation protein AC [Firmicutes bacterium]|nr:stage V sporulation protein AC [Bacillota bacterium]